MKRPRRAIPASEKGQRAVVAKVIGDGALADSGKKNPAKLPGGSAVAPEDDEEKSVSKRIFVPLIKANKEEQTITGVVLQPEVVDAQGDIIGRDVIRKAAHNFLAKYNKATELGLMHKHFGGGNFELYESWIAPQDVVINGTLVKEGSWVMTVKVLKAKVWNLVKTAKLTGFSIGGKAKVKKIPKASI